MKTNNELRAMSNSELQHELLNLRKVQFSQRLKKASGSLDKQHLIKKTRRMIATIKTIMTEKGGMDK